MALFSKRLLHVVTRADLSRLVTSSYAAAANVDDEEAFERMERAVGDQRVCDQLYQGLSDALAARKGARTSEDELIDKLSQGVQSRRSKVRAAEGTPGIAAVMVMLNLELGYAPEMMRNALANEKGQQLLRKGLQELGAHLLRELIK